MDVYRMVKTGFGVWWVSVFYVVAVGLLCVHLSHGLSAMFQSLGFKTKSTEKLINRFACTASCCYSSAMCRCRLQSYLDSLNKMAAKKKQQQQRPRPQKNDDAENHPACGEKVSRKKSLSSSTPHPAGAMSEKWDKHRFNLKLVNPANKRKYEVIVVGSGLAGASAATLAELGYNVKCFCYQDSPRRAHSIAAQGGINAAKNYQNDGDSVFRLFHDTVKVETTGHEKPTFTGLHRSV